MIDCSFCEKILGLPRLTKILVFTDNASLFIGKLVSCLSGIPLKVHDTGNGFVCIESPRFDDFIPDLSSREIWFCEDFAEKEKAIQECKPDYVFDERDCSLLRPEELMDFTPRVSVGER